MSSGLYYVLRHHTTLYVTHFVIDIVFFATRKVFNAHPLFATGAHINDTCSYSCLVRLTSISYFYTFPGLHPFRHEIMESY